MGGSGRPKPLNQYYGTPQTPILYNMHNVGADLLFRDVIQPMKIKQQKEQALQRADREELRLMRLKKFERSTPSLGSLEEMPKPEPKLEPDTQQVEKTSDNFNEMFEITGTPPPKKSKSMLKSLFGRDAVSPDVQTPGTARPMTDRDAVPTVRSDAVGHVRGVATYNSSGTQLRGTGKNPGASLTPNTKGKYENELNEHIQNYGVTQNGVIRLKSTEESNANVKRIASTYGVTEDGVKSKLQRIKGKQKEKNNALESSSVHVDEVGDLSDDETRNDDTGELSYFDYGESKSDDDTI
jgi:hypothetical protein